MEMFGSFFTFARNLARTQPCTHVDLHARRFTIKVVFFSIHKHTLKTTTCLPIDVWEQTKPTQYEWRG